MNLAPLGGRAWLVSLPGSPGSRAARTLAAARWLRSLLPSADIAPGAGSLLVVGASETALRTALAQEPSPLPVDLAPGREVVLPTVYDGPDLATVASALGREVPYVIELHTSCAYEVEFLGFLPGFGYLGPVPPPLALPRRPAPRPAVPARSVAVAAGFTGVYPTASPGGWHLLGRAPSFVAFDPHEGRPTLVPGDRVRFVAVDHVEEAPLPRRSPPRETSLALRVLAAPACATVQDAGRPGHLALGLPASGPLDAPLHEATNAAVGNSPGAAAIEIPQGSLEVEAIGRVRVSVDASPPRWLADGERLRVAASTRAVRYLAIRGGIEAPLVLGSCATMPSAGLGGLLGRPLRRGDAVPIAPARQAPGEQASGRRAAGTEFADGVPRLRLLPGPHLDRFGPEVLDMLASREFTVSRLGDRVGVRLEGAALPVRGGRLDLPVPMVRGAVEVSTDGTPIVLGPDHPVTGGYPVVGVIDEASQAELARRWPGQPVRFMVG